MRHSVKISKDPSGRITMAFFYNPTHVAKVKTMEKIYPYRPYIKSSLDTIGKGDNEVTKK